MTIGSNLIFIKSLPSTNTYVSELAKSNDLPEGTIVYTNYQSAGRGQIGKHWESEEGKNLLISIILYPTIVNPADQFILSMIISLGICDFLKRYLPACTIKWPNDIYIGNDKIAGILIENTIMGDQIENTIAGIGLNINQQIFTSGAPNPVSLSLITGENYDLNTCLNQLSSDLDRRYTQLFQEDQHKIRQEYSSQLYRINGWYDFRDLNGVFNGRIKSVTPDGRLQIENRAGNIKVYSFNEIDFIL
jgi:BirA family biotin operon repressor/biotin-[acetyl-CoA-carboxylase] ligase